MDFANSDFGISKRGFAGFPVFGILQTVYRWLLIGVWSPFGRVECESIKAG